MDVDHVSNPEEGLMRSRPTWTALCATVLAVVLPVATSGPASAHSAEPEQVQGLQVTPRDGFATLAWTPVAGATDYQIERTPVDATDTATGPAVITGLWRPSRQVHQESPSFADAGFNPGDRF